MEDELVSEDHEEIIVEGEGPLISGLKRKQRDLAVGGGDDAHALQNKKDKTGKRASKARHVYTRTCGFTKPKDTTTEPKYTPDEEEDEEVEIKLRTPSLKMRGN